MEADTEGAGTPRGRQRPSWDRGQSYPDLRNGWGRPDSAIDCHVVLGPEASPQM